MNSITKLKGMLSLLFAAMTALWGWFGWLVLALIICLVLDYGTGTYAAGKQHEWRSAAARDGIGHKVGCLCVVMVAGVIDCVLSTILANIPMIELPFTYSVFICPTVVVWYIITELGSILENIVKMGTPVPAWLTSLLKVAQDTVDSTGDVLAKGDKNARS